MALKTKNLNIRLTQSEKDLIKHEAKRLDVKMSDLIRIKLKTILK
jgi:uncharacterized protein (DUF1778 family)